MSEPPLKITVATVTYNAAAQIGRTIASVEAQDYPHVEHLIIDGNSQDDTLATVHHYQERNSVAPVQHEINCLSEPDDGLYDAMNKEGRQIFVTGHAEYDADTLEKEYLRDKAQGLPIHVPANYYPNDDDTQRPVVRWRGHAHLLFSNWLNYFVYQTTPYDIMAVGVESTRE